MKIVLIGYMGSGKSTVGKALSKVLKYHFKDLDTEIEKKEGKEISNIFSEKGEIYFRKKESEIIKQLLSTEKDTVFATGGGTPCYGDTMEYLLDSENVMTIYLKASLSLLTKRLWKENKQRPLIAHLENEESMTDFIRKHLFERAHVYSQADITISVDEKSTSRIIEELVTKLF